MKKLLIFGIAMVLTVGSFAQSMAVQTAFNYLKKGKYEEAVEAIRPALEHPQTTGQAKTWFYYGNAAFEMSGKPEYKTSFPNARDEALRAYTKVLELDKRKEYTETVTGAMGGISHGYFQEGATAYENKSYEAAAENLMKSYTIRQQLGMVDTMALDYVGRSWLNLEKWDKAGDIFTQLKDMGYNNSYVYVALAKIALARNDVKKAASCLEEGEKKFPTDALLLTEKANMYLTTELKEINKDEAVNTLNKLISLDPNNHILYYNVGITYAADSSKFDKAVESYKKAIELNPNYANAYYNLSSLYLEKANTYVRQANDLPIDEEDAYNELVDKSKEMLNEAMPYVEKAHELDSNDISVMQILKEIYTKLNMTDKLGPLEAELKSALEKQKENASEK